MRVLQLRAARAGRTPEAVEVSDERQLALLDEEGRTHGKPHDTETAAAFSIAEHAKTMRERALKLLRDNPDGLTDDEGAKALGWGDRLTFGRRRQELCMAGLVGDTGRRRPTPHGRKAIVWWAL